MTNTPSAREGPSRTLLVHQATWKAEGVLALCLVGPSGEVLPPWKPGAHLELVLPSGRVRQYSLCGDPADRDSYTVATLKQPDGRGGSREIHDAALVGSRITVRGPRNRFELVDAADYLLIAGGIGITPIMSMIRQLSESGADWRLVYGGRSRASMAFTGELHRLGGSRVEFVPQDEHGHPDLDRALSTVTRESAIYCCGPEGLIQAVERRCHDHSPALPLHTERFFPTVGAIPPARTGESSGDFEIELQRSGTVLTVTSGRSILDVVRDVKPETLSSCEEGFCGTCETKVIDGLPEHHDSILTAAERAKSATMMICVGRARSPRLVLDL